MGKGAQYQFAVTDAKALGGGVDRQQGPTAEVIDIREVDDHVPATGVERRGENPVQLAGRRMTQATRYGQDDNSAQVVLADRQFPERSLVRRHGSTDASDEIRVAWFARDSTFSPNLLLTRSVRTRY